MNPLWELTFSTRFCGFLNFVLKDDSFSLLSNYMLSHYYCLILVLDTRFIWMNLVYSQFFIFAVRYFR